MAMTREEEKELRLSCSIGTLLNALGSRPDLKEDHPVKEETDEETGEGGLKRNAEDEDGGKKKKIKDEDEVKAIEYFLEDTPDFEEDDPDWVVEEKQYLIQEYGKKIITLGFDDKDRFIYTCEICNVECNQRKILEAHCLGMKHLRKKNMLDRRLLGKDVPDTFKVSVSGSKKGSKPAGKTKPSENEEGYTSKKKNKWSNNYYGYGPGGHPPYPPPPFGPPPGYAGGPPNFPPPVPPPSFYGQWGSSSPNLFNTPPPTVDNKGNNKNSLAGGDTGSLLQKLADCAVKNEKDSELAINVVIALMKSLKDFNHKRGETRFIEILTEADVTFRILKTLKPMNKVPENSPPPGSDDVQNQNTAASQYGLSEIAQGTPGTAQNINLPDAQGAPGTSRTINLPDNQYDGSSHCNPPNESYSGGSGPDYSSQPPVGVPPPSAGKGTNGYPGAGTNVSYGQNPQGNNYDYSGQNYTNHGYGYGGQAPNPQAYGSQVPDPQGYSNQVSNSQSFGNQGAGNNGFYNQAPPYAPAAGGFPNKSAQSAQATDNSNSSQEGQKNSTENSQSGNAAAPILPPPPPPPPPSDGTTPDFSNYGYAAGYSMGYFNVPPPAYNQPY